MKDQQRAQAKAIRIEKDVELPMRDGTILRADVWRPDDDGAYPALVQRTPYLKEHTGSDDWLRLELAVPQGYAAVVQDVRGRFASDGVWRGLTSATWEQEARDTFDTVEWVAEQPWCDGKIGIYGGSYLGAIAFLGANAHPPHLRAIAPAFIGSRDKAHLDTGGAFNLELWIRYHLNMIAGQLPRLRASGEISESDAERITALARDPRSVIEHLPLRECQDFDLPGMPFTLAELLTGDEIGLPRSLALAAIDVPALLIGGWHDVYCARTVDDYRQLAARSSGNGPERSEHRLIMGPWTHSMPFGVQGDLDFGSESLALTSVHTTQLAFFDRHLKDGADALPPVRYFVMGANEWRDTDQWPPPGTTTQCWYLHTATISRQPPQAGEPPDRYLYDPAYPVPTIGGRIGGVAGPRDQSRLARRDDVLCFTSDPLSASLEVIGSAVLVLYAASNCVDTDFVAKLVDVHPDGSPILIASGLARARYRAGYDRETLLNPGTIEEYRINLGPTAIRLPQGHRLAVYICSSDFPWFDRNMNTGNPLGTDASGVIARQAIFHDQDRPSRLELDVARPDGTDVHR
jgi:putative CocE/NonD family hydrolase